MAGIKSLAKDTAIYGVSSIVGRFLNWCLVPLYTIKFPADEYGVVTYIYAVVALALIILTYGMETGFFRFANHERYSNPDEVYSTSLVSLGVSSTFFFAIVLLFLNPIAAALNCPGHASYIFMMALAVALDAYTSIPFAYLRYKKRPGEVCHAQAYKYRAEHRSESFFHTSLPLAVGSGSRHDCMVLSSRLRYRIHISCQSHIFGGDAGASPAQHHVGAVGVQRQVAARDA